MQQTVTTKIDKQEWMNKLKNGEVKFSNIVELYRQQLLSKNELEEFRRIAIDMLKEKLSVKYPKFKKEVKVEKIEKTEDDLEKYFTITNNLTGLSKKVVTIIDIQPLIDKYYNNEIDSSYLNELNVKKLLSYNDIRKIRRITRMKRDGVKFGFETKMDKEELAKKIECGKIKFSDLYNLNKQELISGEDICELRDKYLPRYI